MIFGVVGDIEGDESLLQEFLAAGANTTARDRDLNTALHVTAQVHFVKLLIGRSAELQNCTRPGHTSLFSACLNNKLDEAQSLILRSSAVATVVQDRHWLSLMPAVTDCTSTLQDVHLPSCLQVTDFLVQAGADMRAVAGDGSTALHMATKSGSVNLIQC
ncbi:het domain protein [Stagonosporopsis vannaccii]|nr:het domain protein [Stagonosporopsis vannaccii]